MNADSFLDMDNSQPIVKKDSFKEFLQTNVWSWFDGNHDFTFNENHCHFPGLGSTDYYGSYTLSG